MVGPRRLLHTRGRAASGQGAGCRGAGPLPRAASGTSGRDPGSHRSLFQAGTRSPNSSHSPSPGRGVGVKPGLQSLVRKAAPRLKRGLEIVQLRIESATQDVAETMSGPVSEAPDKALALVKTLERPMLPGQAGKAGTSRGLWACL